MTTLEEVFSNEDSTTLQKFTALLGTLTSVMFLVNTLTQVSTSL
jgi:hypothetical protein